MVGAVVVVFLHNVPYKWFQVFPVFLYPISLVLLAFVTLMGIITGAVSYTHLDVYKRQDDNRQDGER